MRSRLRIGIGSLGLLLICLTLEVWAQGSKGDYERSDRLRELTQNKVFRRWVEPHWSSDGNRFTYRTQVAADEFEFILVDAVNATRSLAFDHAVLARVLGTATGKSLNPKKLPFEVVRIADDGSRLLFTFADKDWVFEPATEILVGTPREGTRQEEAKDNSRRRGRRSGRAPHDALSPDGKWTAFVREHRLLVQRVAGQVAGPDAEPIVLSAEADAENSYEGSPLMWSPDSRKLVALRRQRGQEHRVHFVESSPTDQLQPKLHAFDYLKPGDKIPQWKPHLFDVEARREVRIEREAELFPNPWLDHPPIEWHPDSTRFFYTYNQRGHQVLRVLSIDAISGQPTAVANEESPTFVDYAHKQFLQVLPESDELIWMSERSGWNHLYLVDSRTGQVKNPITQGTWVVRGVDRVDVERREIWFHASGLFPDQDPYFVHYCRVGFDGQNLTKLTSGDGTYAFKLSPDERFAVGIYSRVDLPNVCELRRCSDGALLLELERADWSELLKTGWKVPERFVAKGRDQQTDIHGVIIRPTNFAPGKKYPVIEHIYAGPHSAFVPKAFFDYHQMQGIAELGFIVVQIDGMGTSHRSKAFHDVCWKNLGDSGFPDRIAWMKAAAEKYSEMDLNRVGIYGGSAGGQSSTRAMLAHGDFYKVAVSDCGCHDNRMDKIWWNELWMSWPIGPHYAEQSNVTQAHRLTGKLLLVVGEVDRNVDPASTLQVANALIKADKDFELLLIPGAGHGSAESPYGRRRRKDFFVRHLWGNEPRH